MINVAKQKNPQEGFAHANTRGLGGSTRRSRGAGEGNSLIICRTACRAGSHSLDCSYPTRVGLSRILEYRRIVGNYSGGIFRLELVKRMRWAALHSVGLWGLRKMVCFLWGDFLE